MTKLPDSPDFMSDLCQRLAELTQGVNILETQIPGFQLTRFESPTEPTSYTMGMSLCLIAQGRKRVMLGEDSYDYDAQHFLVTSVDLPVVGKILEASEDRPFLGMIIGLDQQQLATLLVDSDLPVESGRSTDRGIGVSEVTQPMFAVISRLIDLLDTPQHIPILAPLIQKELLYYLLIGPQGPRLRQIVLANSHGHQVYKAIEWLKQHYKEAQGIDQLAELVNMGRSSFYQHFRSITSLSPLQYRKHLRLQEARRLMVVERMDATTAAFAVGYESPTQFNREYRRLFDCSPAMDANLLRQSVGSHNPLNVLTG
ncbi:MAG: AraC family transcriptional regulator [Oceanospirillaceae bacterium]|nr:AraC family transcriptional regulator [Oceanospirillaceae bacterium]